MKTLKHIATYELANEVSTNIPLIILFFCSCFFLDTAFAKTWSEAAVIDRVNLIVENLQPLLKNQNLKLGNISIDWKSDLFQAGARISPKNDSLIELNVHGGLVRFPGVSDDAITLAICHEFGHVLGGSPKQPRYKPKNGQNFYKDGSFEGQADYFATLKCFRTIYRNSSHQEVLKGKSIPSQASQKCGQAWSKQNDKDLCVRTLLASENLITVMEKAKKLFSTAYEIQPASLNEKDNTIPEYTSGTHPSSQCRLDTLTQGALCTIPFNVGPSDTDPNVGVCIQGALGGRPPCWFNANNYPSAWRHLQFPQDSEWNGVGTIDEKCSGTLLDVGSDEANAMVLTVGHCLLNNLKPENFYLGRTLNSKDLVSIPIKSIEFQTMNKTDSAVITLTKTKQYLKNLGFNFYRLGATSQGEKVVNVGIPMRKVLTSSQRLIKANCKIEENVSIKEGIYNWEVLRTTCSNVDGLSGSPLFNPESHEIVGWLNTYYESDAKGKDCDLDKPCESVDAKKEVHPEFSYSQIADKLRTCISNLDFKSCEN